MASVALTDGGRVDWRVENSTLHLQKYNAAGTPVGAEHTHAGAIDTQVVALSNGGYVAVGGFALRGYNYDLLVYDAGSNALATLDAPGGGQGLNLAASPDGGFLVASMEKHNIQQSSTGVDYQWQPLLTLYDNAGHTLVGPVGLAGDLASVTVLANGDLQANWNDGGVHHALTLDPTAPPKLTPPPAPASVTFWDDQGAKSGAFDQNTTDVTPTVRVPVTQTGVVVVNVGATATDEPELAGGVTVTAADVSRGYVEVPITLTSPPHGEVLNVWARFKDDQGLVSDRVAKSLQVYQGPEIYGVTDDAGAQTGAVAQGTTTDDVTPTVRIGLESSGWQAGQSVTVGDNGRTVATATVTTTDVSRGYLDVTVGPLADGAHQLQVGDPPNPLSVWNFAVQAGASSAGGQDLHSPGAGSSLSGGAGADTLTASLGPDVLTGGGGADLFRLSGENWAPVKVTDFAVGTDHIDLSALFRANGYAGADPVADKWVWLIDDGAGGTAVLYDRDGAGPEPQWPNYVLQLQGVAPSGLTWAQLSGGAQSQPPGGAPAEGQVITSAGPGSTLTGGDGADTLNASRGQDQLTGGAGADHFAFAQEPWAPGHITDFTPGTDKINLRALFDAAGFTGNDPFAAGYLSLMSDSTGTIVLYDRDAAGTVQEWPNYILHIDGVTPGQIHLSDWIVQ